MKNLLRVGLCVLVGSVGITASAGDAQAKFCQEDGKNLAPNTMRCRKDNRYYRCTKEGTWKNVGKCKYRGK